MIKFSLLIILLLSIDFARAEPKLIRLCREEKDVYPWFNSKGTGLVQYQLNELNKSKDYRFHVTNAPWKRCQQLTLSGVYDGMIATSYTEDRFVKYQFPTLPNGALDISKKLHSDSFYVYSNKKSKITWVNRKFENLGNNLVGVQLGYSVQEELTKLKIPVHTSFTTAQELISAISNGFIKVAVLQYYVTEHELDNNPSYKALVTKSDTPFKDIHQFLVFNKLFYHKNSKLIQESWNLIEKIRTSQEYQKKINKMIKI